jgi:hypothetical protein
MVVMPPIGAYIATTGAMAAERTKKLRDRVLQKRVHPMPCTDPDCPRHHSNPEPEKEDPDEEIFPTW